MGRCYTRFIVTSSRTAKSERLAQAEAFKAKPEGLGSDAPGLSLHHGPFFYRAAQTPCIRAAGSRVLGADWS